MNGWSPLPLRLILGFGFLYHGVPKLLVPAEHEMFLGMLQGIGVPAAGLMAWVIGILEVASGLALIAGAFTTIAAALMAVNMLVALLRLLLKPS